MHVGRHAAGWGRGERVRGVLLGGRPCVHAGVWPGATCYVYVGWNGIGWHVREQWPLLPMACLPIVMWIPS